MSGCQGNRGSVRKPSRDSRGDPRPENRSLLSVFRLFSQDAFGAGRLGDGRFGDKTCEANGGPDHRSYRIKISSLGGTPRASIPPSTNVSPKRVICRK